MIKWMLLMRLAASLNNFNWAKVTPTPSIAKEVAVYRFDIGLNLAISAGDTLIIKFPAEYPLPTPGPSTCTLREEPSISISCSMSSYSLTYAFPALESADWPIVLTVASITNPSSSITTSSFEFYQYTGSSLIQQLLTGVTAKIDPVIMPSASISTSSQIAAANSTWTLNFSIRNSVAAGGSIEIRTPSWNDGLGAPYIRYYCGSSVTCAGIKNVIGDLACSCNAGMITISLPSALAASDTSISVGLLANPPNGKTVSGFLIKTKSGINYLEQSPVISVTVSSPADITISSVSASKTQVSVETYYYFRIKCSAPVTQSYIMIITLSNEFFISSGLYIVGLAGTSNVQSPSVVSSTITLSSIFYLYSNENTELSFYAYKITNPYSTKPTSGITITVTTAENAVVGYTSAGYSMTFTTNIFTAVAVTALDSTIYATSTYSFTFTLSTKVASDSYLQIKFPTEISILARTAASCTQILNGLLSTSSCAVSGAILTLTSCFSSGFTGLVKFKIDQVTNPSTTAPSAVFEFKAISGENYQILYDNSLSFTATPGVLGSSSFTPTSLITGDITTYTFSITISHPIPSGGVIYIEIASQISLVSPTCTPVSTLASSCNCVYSATSITINNGFTSGLSSGSLGFKVLGVKNPGTTQTSDTFKFYTKYNNLVIDNLLTGLTTTMTTPNTFVLTSVSSSSNTIGDSADFLVSITPKNPVYSGGYVYISAPAQVLIPDSPVCQATHNVVGVSCSLESSGYLKAVLTFSSATVLTNFGFSIKSCKNPTTSKATDSFQMSSFVGIYKIDQILTGVSLAVTSPGLMVISLNINDVGILVSATYSFQLALKNTIPAGGILEVDFPSSIVLSSNSCSGISGCSMPTSTSLIFSYLSQPSTPIIFFLTNVQNPSSASTALISAKSSYQGYSIDSGQVTVSFTCHSPCLTCSTSADTCLTCITSYPYIFQNKCYTTCPSGSTTSSSSGVCQSCVPPCIDCSTLTTKCTTCINPLVQLNNQCVSSCGIAMYSNNRVCASCGTNCDVCSSSSSCSTCANGFYLNAGNCLNTCPVGYFVQNSVCIACSSACKTCSGQMSSCLSCNSGYSLYNSNCVLACPDNTASINQQCFNCSSSCSGCVGSVDNCTACANSYWLYNGNCVNTCPDTTMKIGGSCIDCNTNCWKCTGNPNYCYQCKEKLVLFNGQCLEACPDRMTPLAFVCTNCSDSCSECSGSVTNCVACNNPLLLYKGQCIGSCPGNSTIQVSGICRDCSSPCSTCSETVDKCSSCIDSHYLYNSTCVVSCPDGYNQSESGYCVEIECVPGCTYEKLNNSVCDAECNVKACNYDNEICLNSTSDAILAKVPLPFTVSSVGTGVIVGASKIFFPSTAMASATIALWGVVETGSWIGLLNEVSSSETTQSRRLLSSDYNIQLAFILLLLCVLGHFIVNITFSVVYFFNILQKDSVHKFWLSNKKLAKWFILPLVVFVSFKFIRMLDVSLFGCSCFQASYDKKSNLYKALILFSYISIILTTIPTLGCLIYVLVVYSDSTTSYALALDSLIITALVLLLTIYDIIILSMAIADLPKVNASVSPQGEIMKSENLNIFTTKGDETDRAGGETDITGKIYPEPEDEYRDSEVRLSSRPLSKNYLIEEDLQEDNAQAKVIDNIWNISFEDFPPKNLRPPPSILDIIPEESDLDLSTAEIDEDRNHLVIVNHKPSGRRVLVSKAFELDPDRTDISFDQYTLESVYNDKLKIGEFRNKNTGAKILGQRNFNYSTVVDVEENGTWVIGKNVRREEEYDFAHAFQDPDDPESVVVWNKIGKVHCIISKDFKGLPKLDFRSNLPMFHEKLIGSYDPRSIEIDPRNVHFANLIVENSKIRARRNFIGARVIEVIDNEKYLDKKRRKAENIEEPELEVNAELEEPDIILPTPEPKVKKLLKRPKKPKPKGWENIEAIYLQRLEPSAKLRKSQISKSPSYIPSPMDESYATAANVRPFASENEIEMLRREKSNIK